MQDGRIWKNWIFYLLFCCKLWFKYFWHNLFYHNFALWLFSNIWLRNIFLINSNKHKNCPTQKFCCQLFKFSTSHLLIFSSDFFLNAALIWISSKLCRRANFPAPTSLVSKNSFTCKIELYRTLLKGKKFQPGESQIP